MAESRKLSFWQEFVAGGGAGIFEISIMYPLDVVKTRIQLQRSLTVATSNTAGVFGTLLRIARFEGVGRLYRGITVPLLMETPKRAVKFSANAFLTASLLRYYGTTRVNQSTALIAGAGAGAIEAVLVTPFELIKVRMQQQSTTPPYKSVSDCLRRTLQAGGPFALYRGFESTLWRHVVWNAGYFGCIVQLKQLLNNSPTNRDKTTIDLIAGSIGGTVGTLLNTPLDVLKTRIQASASSTSTNSDGPKYTGVLSGLSRIAREEGPRALYKGLSAKLLRFCPGGGILLVVHGYISRIFEASNGSQSEAAVIRGL